MIYEVLYYIYILVFGAYASLRIACGSLHRRNWRLMGLLCPCLLLLQGLCLSLWSMDTVRLLYPLIAHLPIILILILHRKVCFDRALASVLISYSLCQLPRWVGLVVYAFEINSIALFVIHLALSQLMLMLLDRYCLTPIHEVTVSMHRPILNMGALPLIYYLYEYFVVYTNRRYAHIEAFSELISTAMVLFFVLFVVSYSRESEKRRRMQRQAEALEMEIRQADQEIRLLRTVQEQTAIHRHDLHHHLGVIDSLIASDQVNQASQYIHKVRGDVASVAPERYCANEIANLILGAYVSRAREEDVLLDLQADLPGKLNLPDTELCALLSNGLENAFNAVLQLKEKRTVALFCAVRQEKLLIEIKNPYKGEIRMENALPVPSDDKPHYGCRSIQSIALRRKGVCSFEAKDGIFTLRVAIPIEIIKEI